MSSICKIEWLPPRIGQFGLEKIRKYVDARLEYCGSIIIVNLAIVLHVYLQVFHFSLLQPGTYLLSFKSPFAWFN
jgi:hypothetical protein